VPVLHSNLALQRSVATMSGLVKSLLGMGNPLLDIMAEVDQATLDKYKVGQSCSSLHEVGRPF
jgi:hypothetical protein